MNKQIVQLSNWQKEVWQDPHRFKVINCGRRAGKSTVAALKMVHFATENEGVQVSYFAPSYRQAKEIVWEMLKDYVPEQAITKKDEQGLVLELVNKSRISLKGVVEPDTLRGVKTDLAIFDEVAFMTRWEEIWKVLRPTLVDTKADVWMISTPNGFNHFHDLYVKKDPRFKSFHFTSYDNPYLDKIELDETRSEMDSDAFDQEFMGEFRKMSGLIYPEFSREKHMVTIPDYIDDNWTFTRSLDFGYAHKSALLYFAISPDGKEIYCYDGVYLDKLVIPEIARLVKIKDSGKTITNPVADSAQPEMIEQLRREGAFFRPVKKGKDSVKNGIVKVADLLRVRKDTGKPTLMYSKKLDWVAKEYEMYRWLENNREEGVVREVPYKVNDDAMDASRYFATSYQGGETVQDPNEFWVDDYVNPANWI